MVQLSQMPHSKFIFTVFSVLVVVALLWNKLPATDLPDYFNFADQRYMLGVPNAFDVLTNLLFISVGASGLYWIFKNKTLEGSFYFYVGLWLSLSILLTGFGSAYFHWTPQPDTLTWDRFPMTLAFAGLCSLIAGDRFGKNMGWSLFIILLPLGPICVFAYKANFWTLRPYAALQLATVLFVLISVIIKPKGKMPNSLFYWALGLYALAKVFEKHDHQVFDFLSNCLSGHSIKHILAALALYKILSFFQKKIEN